MASFHQYLCDTRRDCFSKDMEGIARMAAVKSEDLPSHCIRRRIVIANDAARFAVLHEEFYI